MKKECIKVLPTPDVRHRKQYYDAGSIAAQIACVEIPQLNLEETAFL